MSLPAVLNTLNKINLESFEVKNYRAFRDLRISKLGRVNLITGKNNVGKSSLLEAILMYAFRGSPRAFWQILSSRDQIDIGISLNMVSGMQQDSMLISSVVYMFHGTSVPETVYERVPLRLTMGQIDNYNGLSVSVVWPDLEKLDSTPVGIDTFFFEHSILYAAQRIVQTEVHSAFDNKTAISCIFVPERGLDKYQIGLLWDEIALPRKSDLITALQQIDDNIIDVTLKGDSGVGLGRSPYIQLKSRRDAIPLRLLGDGTNRLFGIVLALLNAENGILLVDEISDGFHYSVLPAVWNFIFKMAHRLNVQVFATTHSWDCIEAFQQAAEEDEQDEGVLIRLQNQNGDVTATVFDERRLAVVTREQIEVR